MDYYEKCKNARAFVVLLAALIALLLNIKYKRELMESLIIVLIVIVVFYIISTVAIKLIDKIRKMESNKVAVDDSEEDGETSEESTEETKAE